MSETFDATAGRDPRAQRLAALVACAVRAEPALVRAARLRFLPEADPGVEADLWLSEFVQHRGPLGLVLEARVAAELRAELAREDPELYEQAWELVARLHAHLPPELRLEEEVSYLEHCRHPDRDARIDHLLRQALRALLDPERQGLARWAARALPRFSREILARDEARLLADGARVRLRGALSGTGDREGALAPWIERFLPSELPTDTIEVRLFPGLLQLSAGDARAGGMSLQVPATDPMVLEVRSFPLRGSQREAPPPRTIELRNPGSRVLAVERGRIELRTLLGVRHVLRPQPRVFISCNDDDTPNGRSA